MPIITLGDRLECYRWSRRTLRNAIIDFSDRRFLDFLATLRPALLSRHAHRPNAISQTRGQIGPYGEPIKQKGGAS
jgi:hypothetical protein